MFRYDPSITVLLRLIELHEMGELKNVTSVNFLVERLYIDLKDRFSINTIRNCVDEFINLGILEKKEGKIIFKEKVFKKTFYEHIIKTEIYKIIDRIFKIFDPRKI